MNRDITFRVYGLKKNGANREKSFKKINHALRYLWRIKEVKELYLEVLEKGCNPYVLFAKVGRRRAVNASRVRVPTSWPECNEMMDFRYMPNRYNEIE